MSDQLFLLSIIMAGLSIIDSLAKRRRKKDGETRKGKSTEDRDPSIS